MNQTLIQSPRNNNQNLSFQLILINFDASKGMIEQGGTLKFSIIRGKQVFEETKNITIQGKEGLISLNRARLNFMVFSYDPAKVYQFGLKIQHKLMGEQKCIGECIIDCNSYAQIFLSNGNGAFRETLYLNPQQKIEVELFVGKNRFSLEKLVRQVTSPKSKSNLLETAPVYQHITDKTVKFRQQLSSSPHRSRENPFKRNSPLKNRDSITKTPKKREQFVKDPQVHIQPHYSIASNKQQPTIKPPIQDPVSRHIQPIQPEIQQPIQITIQYPIQQVKQQSIQPLLQHPTQQLSQQPIQQFTQHPIELNAEQQTELPKYKIEGSCQLMANRPQYINEEKEVQAQQPQYLVCVMTATNNQVIQPKQVHSNNGVPQLVAQPMVVVAEQIQIPGAEFKLQNAADLLKEQFVGPSAVKPSQQAINKALEQTDKPTLHSINDQTPQKYQIQEIKGVKVYLKESIQTPKLEGSKEVAEYIIKRASIFKTMSNKLKIFLALLLLIFLIASNYVQERYAFEENSKMAVQDGINDKITPTNQSRIHKEFANMKNIKQSVIDERKLTSKSKKQKVKISKNTKQKAAGQRPKRKEK